MDKNFYIRLLFYGVVVIFAKCPIIFAYDPPIIGVKEALKSGSVAFIGRIVRIEESERDQTQIIGAARIQILHCYYGMDCNKRKVIKMRFVIKTIVERTIPVQYNVSDEVLIVLSKSVSSDSFFFNSNLGNNMDNAYIIGDTFPENFYSFGKIRFINIYRYRMVYTEKKYDIDRVVKERALMLNEK